MFYDTLGWFIFWISLIVAIVLFAVYKKPSNVFYLSSVSLYVFTAGFVIDVFKFERFGILAVLVLSAIVFMGLGYYLSHVLGNDNGNEKVSSRRK
jgi:hypothetical protein